MVTGQFWPGDRIEVVAEIEDPHPIPIGARGTVEKTTNLGSQFEQLWVEWDSGYRLMLVPEDYDCVRTVGTGTKQ